MSLYGSGTEMALHCLLHLVGREAEAPPVSAADLAEFQGVSSSFAAKLFTRLEKAGLVVSGEGVRGGYRLARRPAEISVLAVADAAEGTKPLFRCRDVRQRCVLYGDDPPDFATAGVCGIHAVMLEAEQAMRAHLANVTLADIAERTAAKIPRAFQAKAASWFDARTARRAQGRPRKSSTGEAGATGP